MSKCNQTALVLEDSSLPGKEQAQQGKPPRGGFTETDTYHWMEPDSLDSQSSGNPSTYDRRIAGTAHLPEHSTSCTSGV